MKYAAVVVGFVGGWVLLTMFMGAFVQADAKAPYITSLMTTAPFTALATAGVGLIVVASWLYDRASKR